jgi:hypothetical protein
VTTARSDPSVRLVRQQPEADSCAEQKKGAVDAAPFGLMQLYSHFDLTRCDVRFWPIADIGYCTAHVRFWG